jgi:NAD(P)-dependent dehydrogenase (short-subunit alcohol dehydrogenase family)
MRLARRIAAVTGAAGNGIGRAIALAFAREGADVAVLDIRPAGETVALVKAAGRRAMEVTVDVGVPERAVEALEQVTATLGPIDILVNGAAVITRKRFLDLTLDDWDSVHRVNLRAYFVTGQWVARDMIRRRRGGSIINIASIGSLVATREQAHYCASKGGVLMLTRCMAAELAPHGIRVNAISPGTIETDFNRHLLADPQFRAMRTAPIPLGRVGLPEEIAGVAVLLASDEGSFMVGANVIVDGGQTIL